MTKPTTIVKPRRSKRTSSMPEQTQGAANAPDDGTSMPGGDVAFCQYLMKQLHNKRRDYLVKPFLNLVGHAGHESRLDISTIESKLNNGEYVSFVEVQQDFRQMLEDSRTYGGKDGSGYNLFQKPEDLELELDGLYGRKAGWVKRWNDKFVEQTEQDHTYRSESTSPGVPGIPRRSPPSYLFPKTRELSYRASRTPAQASHDQHKRNKDAEQVNNNNSSNNSNIEANVARLTRSGKRAASPLELADPKRARRVTPKHHYSAGLRVSISEVIDGEVQLVLEGRSSVELDEKVQGSIQRKSSMERREVQDKVVMQVRENCIDAVEAGLIAMVHTHVKKELARTLEKEVQIQVMEVEEEQVEVMQAKEVPVEVVKKKATQRQTRSQAKSQDLKTESKV